MIKIAINAVIMLAEAAAIAALAWLGWRYPFLFAALTVALSLVVGLKLEYSRLIHEWPYYVPAATGPLSLFRSTVLRLLSAFEAVLKAVLAGLAAVFTFSGTDSSRLFWVAVVFAIVLYLAVQLLRLVSIRLDGAALRWGYFRFSLPLGFLFSAGITLLTGLAVIQNVTINDIGWKILLDLPPTPSISEISELLFGLKQAFDDFIVRILSALTGEGWAEALAVLISINMLTGFVIALYASLIAALVRKIESRLF